MKQLHIHLNRILQSILHIHNYTRGIDEETFGTNQMIFDAVCMQLIHIAQHISIIEHAGDLMHQTLKKECLSLQSFVTDHTFGGDKDSVRTICHQQLDQIKEHIQYQLLTQPDHIMI